MSLNRKLADALRPAKEHINTAPAPEQSRILLGSLAAQADVALHNHIWTPNAKDTLEQLVDAARPISGVLDLLADKGDETARKLNRKLEAALEQYDDHGEDIEVISVNAEPIDVLADLVSRLEGAATDNEVCEEIVEQSGVRGYLDARRKAASSDGR